MAFDSFSAFLAMGKHGSYVWSCYGLTFAVVLGLIWHVRAEGRRFFREQGQILRREAARSSSPSEENPDDASQA